MKDYSKYNAKEVLKVVEEKIKELEASKYNKYLRINEVCNELSIFDWWNNKLSLTKLKDMRKFLKEAIKLGYTGYVCFKVGSTGCSSGMWAHTTETNDGYSPDSDFLYKSFTPEYNYWQLSKNGKAYPNGETFDSLTTIKELESYIETL